MFEVRGRAGSSARKTGGHLSPAAVLKLAIHPCNRIVSLPAQDPSQTQIIPQKKSRGDYFAVEENV